LISVRRAVRLHAGVTQGRGVRDWVELEIVDVALELELHHPVDQLACRHAGSGSTAGVKGEQSTAGVTDDSAGVVGPGDDLDRAL
jgi:hypothetical protein